MRRRLHLLTIICFLTVLAFPAGAADVSPGLSAEDSLRLLKEGNGRYQEGKPQYPHAGRERRALTAGQGQHPLAAVLACSDSRVPPELIFDQGIGDLFVIRVAGNVAATDETGSIEYAVDHLAVPLVAVLGHTQCGAVTARVENAKVPPNIAALVELIKPAVDKAREENPEASKEALLNAAIKNNIWQAIEDMFDQSQIIKEKVKEGKLRVIGALYEIDTGQVQWLGPHPEQNRLLGGKASGKKGRKSRKARD